MPMLRRSSTESIDVGDIRQPHRRAIVVGHDQRLIVLGLEHLIVRAHFPEVKAVGKMSLGNIRVGAVQDAAHLLQADAVLVSAIGFSSTRTPGSAPPCAFTWPTPLICESFCTMMVEAASYS